MFFAFASFVITHVYLSFCLLGTGLLSMSTLQHRMALCSDPLSPEEMNELVKFVAPDDSTGLFSYKKFIDRLLSNRPDYGDHL
jgi:hypothetical protein